MQAGAILPYRRARTDLGTQLSPHSCSENGKARRRCGLPASKRPMGTTFSGCHKVALGLISSCQLLFCGESPFFVFLPFFCRAETSRRVSCLDLLPTSLCAENGDNSGFISLIPEAFRTRFDESGDLTFALDCYNTLVWKKSSEK